MQESDFYKKFEHFLFGSLLHKISVYFFKLRRWDKIEGVKLFTGGGGFFAARRCACLLFIFCSNTFMFFSTPWLMLEKI